MKEGSTDPDDETGDPAGDYVDEDEDEKPKPKSRASKGTVTPKKKVSSVERERRYATR